ncbi:MAG TPA: alpha/beta fold hydrolase [Candidatus Thermoplasmatota archaeon]|jgi:pimeloyl-ACP methyl ester carboxylesterase|nr:alpha/beta fold hydrolase [Candidatus Thermoplasmatota archaeon]
MARWLILVALLLLLPLLGPGLAAPGEGPSVASVQAFSILVDGQVATGLIGVPASGSSNVLVVMCHGRGGSAAAFANELAIVANHGWLGVAMDFRGPGTYNVYNGEADTLAATRFLQARHPITRTVLWSFSMGGHVAGMAAMDGPGLYDIWVNAAGISNWAEVWALNSVVAGDSEAVAHDAGGPPYAVPLVYVDRSPGLNPMGFLDSGLQHAYLIYGAGDMAVPSDQGQQLALNLLHQNVPVSMYTAVRTADPTDLPGHMKMGFNLVLDRAAGQPPGPLPFVEGIADLSTGSYTPAS